MSSETLRGAAGRPGKAAGGGIVVLAHGGAAASRMRTSPVQGSVLRMIPVAAAVRDAVGGGGAEVRRARFRLRGWNGADAGPVADLTGLLDQIAAAGGRMPVVLAGHSMGGRAVLRAAGHPLVSAVAGLAPWLPPGRWPSSRYAAATTACCAGRASGTPSRPSSPGCRWDMRQLQARWPALSSAPLPGSRGWWSDPVQARQEAAGRGRVRGYPRSCPGRRTTVRKKSSICRTAAMNWLTSTGLVT